MEMSDYLGQIVIDNRTEGTTITISAPTLTNADIADKAYPYVVEPPSGEQKINFKLFTGIFNDASKDRIEMPITLKRNSDGTTSSGTIRIFTADGNTNPSSVIFQMNIDGQVTSQTLSVGDIDSAVSADVFLDKINVIFSDDENLTSSAPNNSVIDKAVGVLISSLTE